MDLSVRLFAVLRERAGTEELHLTGLPGALSVGELKREIASRHPALGDLSSVAGVVNECYVSDATALSEGDRVALLPPVSGGQRGQGRSGRADGPAGDYARGVFEISAAALDPGALQARVADPACGAVVTFTGTTRARNRGQDVVRLDYEAFLEMAGPEMARIFAECRTTFGSPGDPERALRMLCVHRVGTVEVGEPSVVIAVASPHRDRAFRAARFLIDTLKERLPVWKKEVYADGHHWIGDRS